MKDDESDGGDDTFTLKGPQSHQSSHEESLRAPGVERGSFEDDPADDVSEAGVADAGSDGE